SLHDEAAQLLGGVYVALDELAWDLPRGPHHDRLQKIRELLGETSEQLRRLSHELRPTILDDLGLLPAIEFLAEGVSKRTGLSITVEGSMERSEERRVGKEWRSRGWRSQVKTGSVQPTRWRIR